ncbi:uncharacterized protein BO96DRAFT_470685 [Aspergillus niger CBS 101883]|uniref:uncharacterized protein n=1 Tax=Aspergillus lacticoffeatus (strain CBS 101883) TaxID=1450533 RepID=UPI000D7F9ED2|nr:uncharacterized protein BO96DRAFT_470685 [Aspergillus niger CBS 101883]PYH50605.1 hypothetical protein BO96DRAFT_470685 [Aspergillus niger CBS 101883]
MTDPLLLFDIRLARKIYTGRSHLINSRRSRESGRPGTSRNPHCSTVPTNRQSYAIWNLTEQFGLDTGTYSVGCLAKLRDGSKVICITQFTYYEQQDLLGEIQKTHCGYQRNQKWQDLLSPDAVACGEEISSGDGTMDGISMNTRFRDPDKPEHLTYLMVQHRSSVNELMR